MTIYVVVLCTAVLPRFGRLDLAENPEKLSKTRKKKRKNVRRRGKTKNGKKTKTENGRKRLEKKRSEKKKSNCSSHRILISSGWGSPPRCSDPRCQSLEGQALQPSPGVFPFQRFRFKQIRRLNKTRFKKDTFLFYISRFLFPLTFSDLSSL